MPEDLNKVKKYVEHYIEHIDEHADKLKELSKEVKSKDLLKYFEEAIKSIEKATASLRELQNRL